MFQKIYYTFSPEAKRKDKVLNCDDIEQWRCMVLMDTFVKGYVAGILILLTNWICILFFFSSLFCRLSVRKTTKY